MRMSKYTLGFAEEEEEEEEEEEVKTKLVWVKRTLRSSMHEFGRRSALDGRQLEEEARMLKALAAADKLKQAIAVAKNGLESYVYAARGMLREEIGEEVSTEEEREQLLAALEAVEDWLYEQDSEEDTVEKFEGKLKETKASMAAVEHRASEYEKRPEAVEKCKEVLSKSGEWVRTLKNRTWIKESDVKGLEEKIEAFREWLSDAEAQQAGLALTEAPYFNSSTAINKAASVKVAARKLLSKKKPKAPPKPLDYIRCESGKNKTSCGRCTHYASGCYSFGTCKSNSTRYALYGKSKCKYSDTEKGCVYSTTKDTILGYPCYKGIPKKTKPSGSEKADSGTTGGAKGEDSGEGAGAKGEDSGEGGSEKSDAEADPAEEGSEEEGSKKSEEESSEEPAKDEL